MTMFVCHFGDLDLLVEKEGTTEEADIDFEIGGCILVLGVQENFKQSLSAFFFRDKKE